MTISAAASSPDTSDPSNLEALTARLAALEAVHAAVTQARDERIRLLEEQNRWLKAQLFGRSSEKPSSDEANPDQGRLFNECEAHAAIAGPATDESIAIPAHQRKKRGRKKLSADLPRVEIVHDIPESERTCAKDGTALTRIGEEVSEQLDYQPAKVRVLRHIRPKYVCPCCHAGVKIAPVAPQLFPKSFATPALIAHIATAKFVDHIPLYRQEAQWARLGIHLGRATMALWMVRFGGTHIVPIVNLLAEHLIAQPLLHCDETRLQVLKSDKAPTADHWMWVRCAGPPGRRIVLFDYDPSRAGAVPKRLLEGFSGILLTDGYEPYAQVASDLSLIHAGCWTHARRKFDEARKAQTHSPESDGYARAALTLIGELYAIERTLNERTPAVSAEERVRVRQQLSAPAVNRLHVWLAELAPRVLPESLLGKAVRYTLNQWAKLTAFLNHAEVPLDNNRAENAIRPFVVGRKGWLFADTVAGAKASANLFSLVESAKANGFEPHAYLAHLIERLPTARSVEDFEALLPWNVRDAQRLGR